MASPPRASVIMANFVLAQLERHQAEHATKGRVPPLFVGMQGPQGSGKTYLTSALRSILFSPPHSLRLAVFSTDDLYLSHDGLTDLAQAYPSNAMLQGRGLPGSHDLALGSATLASLARAEPTRIPRFDKSAFNGAGDRASEETWELIEGPVDVVLLEGWSLGFRPLEPHGLVRAYAIAKAEKKIWSKDGAPEEDQERTLDGQDREEDYEDAKMEEDEALEEPKTFLKHDLESLGQINEFLRGYVEAWYPYLQAFIQLSPPNLKTIYGWRTQQEHDLQARTPTPCMTDEQVIAFVDRYMPGYELFLEGVRDGKNRWAGRGVAISLGAEREVVSHTEF